MKLEAIRRKAGRPAKTEEKADENNSPQVAANFRADDEVAKDAGISGDTVRRYIRLTELTPELQQMVDEKKIGMTPAVEISYLKPEEQQMLLTAIDSEQATPSLSQAQRITKHPNYKYLSDANPKNAFDIEKFLSTKLKLKPEEEFEVFDAGAAAGSESA